MSKISGRVVLRDSDVGIPHLLITAYDIKTAAAPVATGTLAPLHPGDAGWECLGWAVTDERGAFVLSYDLEGDAGHGRECRDLAVIVSVPAERGTPEERAHAHLAMRIRRNAKTAERVFVQVDEQALKQGGNRTTLRDGNSEELLQGERIAAERDARRRAAEGERFAADLARRRRFEELAEPKFAKFLAALSVVSPVQGEALGGRYVKRGDSLIAANRKAIESGIVGRVNSSSRVGVAALRDEDLARFRTATGAFRGNISASEIGPYLRPRMSAYGPSLVRQTPPSLLCRETPVDPCVDILEGREPVELVDDAQPTPTLVAPPNGPGSANGAALTASDIPELIADLVRSATPPENASIFTASDGAGLVRVQQKLDGRAKADEIQGLVNGFILHSGPADAPSLHDFHHLQIAFEHVWQELFDDGVVQTGKELYTDLVELGLDPNDYLLDLSDMTFNFGKKSKKKKKVSHDPPVSAVESFELTREQWTALSGEQQKRLKKLAKVLTKRLKELTAISDDGTGPNPTYFKPGNEWWMAYKREQIRIVRQKAQAIIGYADAKLRASDTYDELHPLLTDLAKAMKEPYRFSIYAATRFDRSVNFGLIATYRQKWAPVSYQVGELVKTVPLAPKEVRRFSKKVTIRRSRSEKEVQNALRVRKTESAETARTESEIVQKAMRKTNFQMGAEGGVNIGIASAKGSTALSQDAAVESQEVKKEFREAIFKATEEYKAERTTEVNVSTGEETSLEESGEISNPNDEITVTYLFYELQRRYRISEHLHRVTPVVLVAQEFPRPDEIDEDWIIAHDWILRRVILDDSFIPAMNYVASKVVGDEFALKEMHRNLQQQRRITEDLKEEVAATRARVGGRYAALQKSIERRAEAVAAEEESGGIIPMPVGFLISESDDSVEAQQVREEAARDAYEREAKLEKEIVARLERETTALTSLTETYTKELSDHLNRREQIARLRVHIKANIMYYMQAIWSHEPPDQRVFRLHEVRVPRLTGTTTYTLEDDPGAIPIPPEWKPPTKLVAHCELETKLEYDSLEEVADLDNLLGFKGNYMIFPLKKSNALTDFMMTPYLDPIAGLSDPDPLGNWTVTDLVAYVCCLRERLPKADFERLRPGLMAAYRQLVNTSGGDGEEIVVPTDSLYIEALPGAHPILEDFKLFHRVLDVKKVQAEVRGAELENLRAAARLLAGEREDPTIEKKVVIEGGTGVVLGPGDA